MSKACSKIPPACPRGATRRLRAVCVSGAQVFSLCDTAANGYRDWIELLRRTARSGHHGWPRALQLIRRSLASRSLCNHNHRQQGHAPEYCS